MRYRLPTLSIALICLPLLAAAQEQSIVLPLPQVNPFQERVIDESQAAAKKERLKSIIGFPFDLEHETDEFKLAAEYYGITIGGVEDRILQLHEKGLLADGKRQQAIQEIIRTNAGNMTFPLEGMMDIKGLMAQEKNADVPGLFAALMISSRDGEIGDIVSCLELSRVCISPFVIGIGEKYYMTRMPSPVIPKEITAEMLPPEKRLELFPAANVIIKNPTVSVPLLYEVVKDPTLRRDLRLRAATFLYTIDADLLHEGFYAELEPELADEVRAIKTYDIQWREMIPERNLGEYYRIAEKRGLEQIRRLTGNPDITAEEVARSYKENEEKFWGKY